MAMFLLGRLANVSGMVPRFPSHWLNILTAEATPSAPLAARCRDLVPSARPQWKIKYGWDIIHRTGIQSKSPSQT